MSVKPDSLLIWAIKQVGYMQLKPLCYLLQRVQPGACTITDVPNRGLWHSAQLRSLPDSQASLFQYFLYFNFHLAPPAIGCAKIAIKILILLELCPFM